MKDKDALIRETEKRRVTKAESVLPIKAFFTSEHVMYINCDHLEGRHFGIEIEDALAPYPYLTFESNDNFFDQPTICTRAWSRK